MIEIAYQHGFKGIDPTTADHADIQQAEEHDLIWLDVTAPSDSEIERLRNIFHFHPLSIEDAVRANQRPKVDRYPDYLFVIFYAFEYQSVLDVSDDFGGESLQQLTEPDIKQSMIAFFVNDHYVVSWHDRPQPALQRIKDSLAEGIQGAKPEGAGMILYYLLDSLVDDYFPMVDQMSDDIDELESRAFTGADKNDLAMVFKLRQELQLVRRIIGPERDMMNVLVRHDVPLFSDNVILYMQDVYDHLVRIIDMLDSLREMLAGTIEAHLMVVGNRTNEIMKTLTASSIILMTASLIAGLYGMNFQHIPGSSQPHGFITVVILSGLLSIGIWLFLKRIKWF